MSKSTEVEGPRLGSGDSSQSRCTGARDAWLDGLAASAVPLELTLTLVCPAPCPGRLAGLAPGGTNGSLGQSEVSTGILSAPSRSPWAPVPFGRKSLFFTQGSTQLPHSEFLLTLPLLTLLDVGGW